MSEITRKSSIPELGTPGYDVLIVSQDKGFIDHHRGILMSIGFLPITVPAFEAALAVLHTMVIEMVIVDEGTAVLETQKFLKQAREDRQKVPVLVVSQKCEAKLRRQALELGAAGYLDHPAFQDDVVLAILPDRPAAKNRETKSSSPRNWRKTSARGASHGKANR